MQNYLYVVTVGLKEVGRTVSRKEARKIFVAEMHLLFDTGAGQSAISGCWIEAYILKTTDSVALAIKPETELIQYRKTEGVSFFNDVIRESHENGWMREGKWVDEAQAA